MLLPTTTQQIRYVETDFSTCHEHALKVQHGIYMAVISGTAQLETGTEVYHMVPQMELSFISGSIIRCVARSHDFRVRVFVYTHALLTRIALPIDHIYFDYNEAHPTYVHTPDARSQRTWRELMLWMDLAESLFAEGVPIRFRGLQEETFLQGFWMWNFGTIQERIDSGTDFSNTQLMAHRFIRLVKAEATTHRRVEYYADRLHISRRYLNKIIARHTCGRTPKQLIDACLVAEIKERLLDTRLTVTQIADQLDFPDPANMSRFFSRLTGTSPLQYRKRRTK